MVNSFHSGINIINGDTLAGLAVAGELLVGDDNDPPDCSNAEPNQAMLWPPNRQMEIVNVIGVTDPDDDSITITITGIFQDERTDINGGPRFTPDGEIVGDGSALIRAECIGNPQVPGNGRVYHIDYTAADGEGGECSGEVLVGVSHDNRPDGDATDEGRLFDSTQIN